MYTKVYDMTKASKALTKSIPGSFHPLDRRHLGRLSAGLAGAQRGTQFPLAEALRHSQVGPRATETAGCERNKGIEAL